MVHCWVFLFFPLSSFLSRPPSSHLCSPSPSSLLSLLASLALPPLGTLFTAGEMEGRKPAGLQKQRKKYKGGKYLLIQSQPEIPSTSQPKNNDGFSVVLRTLLSARVCWQWHGCCPHTEHAKEEAAGSRSWRQVLLKHSSQGAGAWGVFVLSCSKQ